MKALFIGAHTDEELCFAGTMTKLVQQGCVVKYDALSCCENDTIRGEFEDSCRTLGITLGQVHNLGVREFAGEANQIADSFYTLRNNFDYVFTHSPVDRHPDHRTVAEETLRVFSCNLLTYIGPWNGNEDANYFVEITSEQLEKKIQALACYKSQAHRPYMNSDFIRSWARYNGMRCGKMYAEGFRVVRLIQ